MKAILTLQAGNKAERNFCRDLDMTIQEYELLHKICTFINRESEQNCASVYLHEIS